MKRKPRKLQPKIAIDRLVAELLGQKVTDVSGVTEAFLHEVINALVDGHEVRLDGLGIVSVVCVENKKGKLTRLVHTARRDGSRSTAVVAVPRKYYVRFRKSTRLREAIQARHGRPKPRRIRNGEVRS